MNTPHDDPHGDLLARILHSEADTVRPAGDGLTRIRERVEQRRHRRRWLVPTTSLVTAGALAGAAFGAYSAVSGSDQLHSGFAHSDTPTAAHPTSGSPSATPAPRPSSSAATTAISTPIDTGVPTPVWPFTGYDQVLQWERQYPSGGASPWHLSATFTASTFAQNALQLPAQHVVVVKDTTAGKRSGYIVLATKSTGRPFATVHLVRWGTGKLAPWEIVGVDAADPSGIDTPTVGAGIASPLTVHYQLAGGAEDDVYLSVWDGNGRLGQTHQVAGGGAHQATVRFSAPATTVGYVVMADLQSGSGTPVLQRLVVTPVRFSPTAPAKHYPAYFVAVRDQRLGVFYSTSGGLARWLTQPQPGGGPSLPQLTSDHRWVYFLRGQGSDQQSLMRVSINGGAEHTVVAPNGTVTTFAVGGDHGQLLAYVVRGQGGALSVEWQNTDTGNQPGGFAIPAAPPAVEALAWAPDGTHLAAQVRGGNEWALRIYDTNHAGNGYDRSGNGVYGGTAVPCAQAAACAAPSYDAAGNLYFVEMRSSGWALRQWTGSTVNGVAMIGTSATNDETATVDITPDAYAAIVGTADGRVYRVDNGRATLVTKLAAQPTW